MPTFKGEKQFSNGVITIERKKINVELFLIHHFILEQAY